MNCADCGNPTAGGQRCRSCHGRRMRESAAVALTDSDRELLKMRDDEHLTHARIAARLGLSRARVAQRIRDARRRERTRERMDHGELALEGTPGTPLPTF